VLPLLLGVLTLAACSMMFWCQFMPIEGDKTSA